MMLYRASTAAHLAPTRSISPRSRKPDFRDGSTLEERDKVGRIISTYRIGKLLGRGGFAKCYEATETQTNISYALKVIDRSSLIKSKTLEKLHSEIAIHRRMKHKNIVAFHKTFQDDYFVYILLELCSGQTLMEASKTRRRFSTEEAQFIMIQTIAALQYMHENNVIHRDLKLGNMMLDADMNVKLGDFGLAAELMFDGERKRTICGTPNYIAPEILEGARGGHSFEVDIWSLGVILFTLIVGEPPFQTNDVKTTYNRIKQCRYTFPYHVTVSESGKALVHRILQSCPNRRPSLIEIRNDPFLRYPEPPMTAPLTMFPPYLRKVKEREAIAAAAAAVAVPPVAPLASVAAPVRFAPLSARDPNERPRDPLKKYLPGPKSSGGSHSPLNNRPVLFADPQNGGLRRNEAPAALPRVNSMPCPPVVGGWCDPVQEKNPTPRPSDPAKAEDKAPTAAPPPPPAHGRKHDEDDDDQHIKDLHQELHKTLLQTEATATAKPMSRTPLNLAPPTVWVTHYADFSQKYGLTYRLNTGHTGVHYNDSTKIVWEPITNRVEYYARVKDTVNGVVHALDQRSSFHMDTFPDTLNKKITLVKYFKTYLSRTKGVRDGVEVVQCTPHCSTAPVLLTEPHMVSEMVYVKRWLITKQAMIFRLSNRTIQVCFFDNTEILLSSESKVVTFTEASGHRRTFPLSAVNSQSEDLANRLKYTKDILTKLMNNREL